MRYLLLAALVWSTATSLYAQRNEVGINGGISTTSIPGGTDYPGTTATQNVEVSARFLYSIHDYLQIGADVGTTTWTTTGNWPLTGPYGQNYGNQKVTYSFASPAITICGQLNYVLPFYSRLNLSFIQSQLYAGISAGGVITANDGTNGNTLLKPENYNYTSHFDYENGKGFVAGIQVGYSYFFSNNFGLNIEVAPRYASVYMSDARYAHEFEHYHLYYYSATIGLRYRFGDPRSY